MEFITPDNLAVFDIIFIVIGVIFAIQGIAQLATGKMFGKEYQKYTEESVKKASRPLGVCFLIIGLCFIAEKFIRIGGDKTISSIVFLGLALATIAVMIVINVKLLEKKDNPKKLKSPAASTEKSSETPSENPTEEPSEKPPKPQKPKNNREKL